MQYFGKKEEAEQVISGLLSINELINNGLFQLDEEIEQEMLKCGAIEMDVEEMQMCLESTIDILEHLSKLINNPLNKGSK